MIEIYCEDIPRLATYLKSDVKELLVSVSTDTIRIFNLQESIQYMLELQYSYELELLYRLSDEAYGFMNKAELIEFLAKEGLAFDNEDDPRTISAPIWTNIATTVPIPIYLRGDDPCRLCIRPLVMVKQQLLNETIAALKQYLPGLAVI